MSLPQTDATSDPQNIVAVLQQRLDAALSEKAALAEALALRNSEFGERIEHQAATLDVLKAMSASPGDPQPVFDLIVRHATELCNVPTATLFEYDGHLVHIRSSYLIERFVAASPLAAYRQLFPMRPTRGSISCRAILDRQIVHIRDLEADPELAGFVRELGHRSQVSVPLIRNGLAIGVISITTREPGGFSDSQIELLKTFAEQAVIAITSAETYRALQERTAALAARNSEYGERIEQQSATIDVLKVMSSSPGDARPVFELVVERARAFCNADYAAAALAQGGMLHLQAASGMTEGIAQGFAAMFPRSVGTDTLLGRAILSGATMQSADVIADPEHFSHGHAVFPTRSVVAVPLLRGGSAIGALTLARRTQGEFSATQMELLRTFAEQAVIAITSAETYRALQTRTSDLQETLEYQTAISDVLKVISQSAFDLQPVLDTLVETAARLCEADQAVIVRRKGETVWLGANCGFPPEYEAAAKALGVFPLDRNTPSVAHRALSEGRIVHIHDVAAVPGYPDIPIRLGKQRTSLAVPLLRESVPIGVILLARQRVEPFTDRQIELISTFADQAVIAIENTRLLTEQREALEQQTAMSEVLQVINSSLGKLAPVFDAVLERALRLCESSFGILSTYDGEFYHTVAMRDVAPGFADLIRAPFRPSPGMSSHGLVLGKNMVHVGDVRAEVFGEDRPGTPGTTTITTDPSYDLANPIRSALADQSGARTAIWVALRRDDALIGMINIFRQEVRPYSDQQIALLEIFASHAVIAMENARLINEQKEALEQQTATAEVLQVINASAGNLAPVFDAMLDKALRLCDANFGQLITFDGVGFRAAAWQGYPPEPHRPIATPPTPGMALYRLIHGEEVVHIPDITADEVYRSGNRTRRRLADEFGGRTAIWVALKKDTALLGAFVIYRTEVRPFSHKQIALLQNFGAQAVIAMENARLLDEIRQRQEELRITFENMGDGVAMFDETPRLVAWNRKFQDILDLPDGVLAERPTFAEYIRYLAEHGEYGAGADPEEQIRRLTENADQSRTYERTRPDGRVIEIRHNPVPGGGFVLIYADITERKRNEAEIRAARDAAEEASRTIEAAYRDLKAAQANLIQAEKMASLGQLTAGIAHEIKNPLNFVNNFAALSVDLLGELHETAAPGFAALTSKQRAEIDDVSAMLTSNLQKITEHGKRADGIVKAMLEHSRGSSGERHAVDLNALIDEALNLAYHGARAQDQSFNITLERDFDEGIAPFELVPQDITRVLLNLFANGFYATTRRARDGADGFEPTLRVGTRAAGEMVEIRVWDNGIGIPADIRDKLFQPFFTTKPTGEGTGLGLSISYDIITQQHGGSIAVDSKVGEYSEFTIRLPRNS